MQLGLLMDANETRPTTDESSEVHQGAPKETLRVLETISTSETHYQRPGDAVKTYVKLIGQGISHKLAAFIIICGRARRTGAHRRPMKIETTYQEVGVLQNAAEMPLIDGEGLDPNLARQKPGAVTKRRPWGIPEQVGGVETRRAAVKKRFWMARGCREGCGSCQHGAQADEKGS